MKVRLIITASALVIASLLMSANVLAQKHQENRDFFGGPPSAAEKLARMSEALNLTGQQEIELLGVLQEQEAKRQALREQARLLMGPEICSLMIETEGEILAILDSEQAEQFSQLKQNRREGNRNRRGMGPPDCSEYDNSDG
jgi:Spy/CpxP family protein refolding chaperone